MTHYEARHRALLLLVAAFVPLPARGEWPQV